MWFGHAWEGNPHYYFRERKVGTYLSFLNLLATGVVSALIAGRLRPAPVARFWWASSIGFVWMACDDLFLLHERIDLAAHALLGLDPGDPVTDHLDDLIVALYGVVAWAFGYRFRTQLMAFRWMVTILTLAYALFTTMVLVDFFHLSNTIEDALKVVAGTFILVGVLAAWFETKNVKMTSSPGSRGRASNQAGAPVGAPAAGS
jgi:hypothetical protein